jgi:ParB family chromosome partitioning protein
MKLVQTGVQVPVGAVRISPYHFRKETVEEKLDALAKSLQEIGQIHNISVVLGEDGEYELANGHRRLLAAKRAGFQTIRADIYEFTPDELADEQERQRAISQFLLAANQTEPLIPLERARFYRDVMEKFGWDVDRISEFYGVAKADILHDLKYLNISPKVFDIVAVRPDRVGRDHLELLAEYSSSDKKGWRISETEQVALAETLVAQTDKVAAEDPKEFERTIRQLKAEERKRKAQQRKAQQQRQPVQVVKDVVRALEGVDGSCKALARIDVPPATVIELVDKREIIDRCYELAQMLTNFADAKIGPLPLKKVPVEVGGA